MTSKEFVIWMKGFITACNDYAPTPKQWDIMKEELEAVNDAFVETPGMFQVHPEKPYPGVPIGEGGWGTPNTTPNWQWPHYPNPLDNPFKVTCQPGTTITTTPGTGFVTIANPNIASFGTTGSITYNNPPFGFGSTSTTCGYPSGSAWSYTNQSDGPYSTQDDNSLKPTKQTKFKKRKAKSVKEWEDNFDLGGGE